MRVAAISLFAIVSLSAAAVASSREPAAVYHDNTGRTDVATGGVRMIPVRTASGEFHVWTKRVGNNPKIKLLLLHGGPGATHEYFELFDSYLPAAGIEYYYYDQLGSFYSDQPTDEKLWDVARFADEVEQVRSALGLDRDNFFLLGHSAGGMIAIEYALAHPEHLKGLIVSNMMASIPAYNEYARTTLMPQMDKAALAEVQRLEAAGQTSEPRYMEILVPQFYEKHILLRPYAEWPDPVLRTFKHLNGAVYVPMQGPSELGASGKLANWDRFADLGKINVPALVIGARHDTMDPGHLKKMAERMPNGRYLYCPNAGHLAMYDDQPLYVQGVITFLKDVAAGKKMR